MGDVNELKMQITPETPGRIPVLNPFESPGDYSNLHEQTLASPSVFKSTKLPVVYRSTGCNKSCRDRPRRDSSSSFLFKSFSFFTKDVIVPSPWTDHDGKQPSEHNPTKCLNKNSDSPIVKKLTVPFEKCNVERWFAFVNELCNARRADFLKAASCQTLLSLPVDFNLEAILELMTLWTNLLKPQFFISEKKTFLDGNGSISDTLPSASPGSPPSNAQASLEGQFSSSPIQNRVKKYSLGSITSPSPISSPTFSPITLQLGKTPRSEQRFTFHSPDASSGTSATGISNPSIRSPYIDGCSPIKNWSPLRLGAGPQYQTSRIRIPFTLESHSEDEEDNVPSTDLCPLGPGAMGVPLQQLNVDTSSSCGEPLVVTAMSITQSQSSTSEKELALLEDIRNEKENDTVDMVDPIETADESTWIKEPVDNGNLPMTDFVNGIAFSIENSHMCMLPLAESSVLPCESSNIQMDSGYNTQTYGSNITDTVGTESYCKENDAQSFEVELKPPVCNTKHGYTVQRCWMKSASPSQCSTP